MAGAGLAAGVLADAAGALGLSVAVFSDFGLAGGAAAPPLGFSARAAASISATLIDRAAGAAAAAGLAAGAGPVAGAAAPPLAARAAASTSAGDIFPAPGAAAGLAAAAFAAGLAAAVLAPSPAAPSLLAFRSSFTGLGGGASTTRRKSTSMSYQPMLLCPSNSTSALPFMLTVRTVPVSPSNRRSSGRLASTTTYLSV